MSASDEAVQITEERCAPAVGGTRLVTCIELVSRRASEPDTSFSALARKAMCLPSGDQRGWLALRAALVPADDGELLAVGRPVGRGSVVHQLARLAPQDRDLVDGSDPALL